MSNIYDLGLHGRRMICDGTIEVVRVPGGWVYTRHKGEGHLTSCFVPYSTEFLASSITPDEIERATKPW